MGSYNVSQLPVVQDGENLGSLTEGTLMARSIADGALLKRSVKDVMDAPFPVVDVDAPMEQIAPVLSRETPAALVSANGDLVGVITRYDVLHKVAGIR